MILCKSLIFKKPVYSLSKISNMHINFSISSFEYYIQILNSSTSPSLTSKWNLMNKIWNTYCLAITEFFLYQFQLHSTRRYMFHQDFLEPMNLVKFILTKPVLPVPLDQFNHRFHQYYYSWYCYICFQSFTKTDFQSIFEGVTPNLQKLKVEKL